MKSIFSNFTLRPAISLLSLILIFSCSNDEGESTENKFDIITSISGERLWQATGFDVDPGTSTCFIATREADPNSGQPIERITKINLETKNSTTSYTDIQDYISKNAHILGNKLLVIGGTSINIYDPETLEVMNTNLHGLELTRFGSAVYNNDIFIWGGDLNELSSDIIYKLNQTTNMFEAYGELSEPRTWAQGEVIDNILYVFGGQEEFENTPIKNTVLIYNLIEQLETKVALPYDFFRTFTAKSNGNIYVAGHVVEGGSTNTILGKFNTQTNGFTEIKIKLTEGENIHQLASDQEYLYALVGNDELFADLKLVKIPLP